ncbi:MAG: winged helix-turn-helix transcriptional regulator [Stellaceae bacterium]
MKQRHCPQLCPLFQAALDVLARPWNGLLMALLEEAGPLRFSELRERLDAMGDRMLSARLKELEARGLVERTVTPGPPVKVTYALSELGHGFGDVQRALGRWGEKLAAASHAKRPRSRKSLISARAGAAR